MRLPPDNDLALAPGNDALVLDRSDRPAPSRGALLALVPAWVRDAATSLRDAVLDALAAQANLPWARIGLVLAQAASPRHAAGVWLDGWGGDLRRPRVAGEGDGPYRARLLALPDVVTPRAIRGAVARVVAEATAARPALLEPVTDAMFVGALDAVWTCFVQGPARRVWGDDPERLGASWGAHVGPRPNARPTPDVPFSELPLYSAALWVILPGDGGLASPVAHVGAASAGDDDAFVRSAAAAWCYLDGAAGPLFERAIGELESRRGGGVPVTYWSDPLLETAV